MSNATGFLAIEFDINAKDAKDAKDAKNAFEALSREIIRIGLKNNKGIAKRNRH